MCNRRQSTKQRSCLRNTLSIDMPRGGERQKSTPMTPRGSSTRSRDCSTVRMPFSSLVRRQRSSNSSGTCKTTTRSSKQELLGLRPWIIRPTEKSLRTPRSTSYGAIGCELRYQVPTRRLRRSPSGTALKSVGGRARARAPSSWRPCSERAAIVPGGTEMGKMLDLHTLAELRVFTAPYDQDPIINNMTPTVQRSNRMERLRSLAFVAAGVPHAVLCHA